MAEKYTHDELTRMMQSPGWQHVKETGDTPATGTLEELLRVAHENRKSGAAPGLIRRIETAVELDLLQIEQLWWHLGLPE